MKNVHQLYYAACEADKVYSEALQAAHGSAGCNVRYQPKLQSPEIRALGLAKVEADEAYRNACKKEA